VINGLWALRKARRGVCSSGMPSGKPPGERFDSSCCSMARRAGRRQPVARPSVDAPAGKPGCCSGRVSRLREAGAVTLCGLPQADQHQALIRRGLPGPADVAQWPGSCLPSRLREFDSPHPLDQLPAASPRPGGGDGTLTNSRPGRAACASKGGKGGLHQRAPPMIDRAPPYGETPASGGHLAGRIRRRGAAAGSWSKPR
jgi:hypothetical protein